MRVSCNTNSKIILQTLFCHVNCKSHELSVACVPFPALVATSFNCCGTPNSRWQRQWIKHVLFKSTILVSFMSQLWANMNTLQVQGSLWMDIQSKRALFLYQLSVAKYTQSSTIWGTYSVWPYMAISVCLQTYVFHHILYSGKFLREKTFANCPLLLPTDTEKLSWIGTKIKRTNELCCHILRSCCVVLVKRLHF